jgi:nitrous oxidase accessory protein NosD
MFDTFAAFFGPVWRSMKFKGSASAFVIMTGILISVTSLPVGAATHCVNPGGTGGCSSSIQQAINAAAPGDTIVIARGIYTENLVVPKSLTLLGVGHHEHRGERRGARGEGAPIVRPAVSNANPCPASSLCGGLGSNIILVQANNVTIRGLTLDGDNPHLTSGIVRGGSDLDARNGIITNHTVGTFDNLEVDDVTVRNVYLRGIYASSGGTFNFHDSTVQNVQGDADSFCMFNFGGAGVMARNRASDCNDALSSNWSRGVQFLDNEISRSGSGVHTDNAGGDGGTSDLIEGNTVKQCQTDGYGIWVFLPYIDVTVRDNVVRGCTVGLAAFGQGAPTTTLFTGNSLNGAGAPSSSPSESLGAIVSTDGLGFGATDASALFTDNVIQHFNRGVYVEQNCEMFFSFFPSDCAGGGGRATVTLYNNVINGNHTGVKGQPLTAVDARRNWWGCSRGPNQPGCDTAIGTVVYDPWLTKPSAVRREGNRDE